MFQHEGKGREGKRRREERRGERTVTGMIHI
jgi:hypothetical protein